MTTQTTRAFAIKLLMLMLMLCRCHCWAQSPQISYVLNPFEGEAPSFVQKSIFLDATKTSQDALFGQKALRVKYFLDDAEGGAPSSDRHHCCSMEAAVASTLAIAGFVTILSLYYAAYTRKQAAWEGKTVKLEVREVATVFFADIVGFTKISSHLDPLKISDMLDRLYRRFDALSIKHDVFKMETVGDCWMGVTNLVDEQPDHVKRIADFSSDVIKASQETVVDVDDPSKGTIQIRVGLHSGPVVGRFIGTRNPRYCLFGDTVNIASRMESYSAPGRINCSNASADLLRHQDAAAKITSRGAIEVKGKGLMQMFWINDVGPEFVPEEDHLNYSTCSSAYSNFNSPV